MPDAFSVCGKTKASVFVDVRSDETAAQCLWYHLHPRVAQRRFDVIDRWAFEIVEHLRMAAMVTAGEQIRAAWGSLNRKAMIDALNYAPQNSPKKNHVPWPRFAKFWRFIIPDFSMAAVPPG